MSMRTVAVHNLGCKVNSYELDKITGELTGRGYRLVDFSDTADIYIVNTCTVTNIADRKSRQLLHRAKKTNPRSIVVAIGCYVDTSPDCAQIDESIDIALGNKEKGSLPDILDRMYDRRLFDDNNADNILPVSYRSRTRAYIKVQDGCNLRCSYCVIPFARGNSISVPASAIIDEVNSLAKEGVKEVVLTGIHVSSYGLDLKGDTASNDEAEAKNLYELLKLINTVEGIERIRLSSLEPGTLTDEAVEALLFCDKLCPHFHLSLQSGCDDTLKRMRRRYTSKDFADCVKKLREVYEAPAITTDVITGFPGETEEEFERSRDFIDSMDFYEMHVFPYSVRKGTSAEKMEGQLSMKEKSARASELIKISERKAKLYRESFINKKLKVLWETEETVNEKVYMVGHTERYVRAAFPIGGGCSEAPKSGEITEITTKMLLNDNTLLADIDFC